MAEKPTYEELKKRVKELEQSKSEHKRTEEALKESEKLYRKLFDSSKDAIMTLEPPTWKFTSGNLAIIEMFKVKDEKEFTSLNLLSKQLMCEPNMLTIRRNKAFFFRLPLSDCEAVPYCLE